MDLSIDDLDADWARLWALAERVAGHAGTGDPGSVFVPVGLGLHRRPASLQPYDVTPAGSVTFASTGGDGVHFSLLRTTAAPGTAPVVMTVPAHFDAPNHVVGASLREFLALGCRTGYCSLDRLAYEWGREAEAGQLEHGRWTGTGWDGETPEAAVRELLDALTREFDLAPWPDVTRRLAELQARYLPAASQDGGS